MCMFGGARCIHVTYYTACLRVSRLSVSASAVTPLSEREREHYNLYIYSKYTLPCFYNNMYTFTRLSCAFLVYCSNFVVCVCQYECLCTTCDRDWDGEASEIEC